MVFNVTIASFPRRRESTCQTIGAKFLTVN